MTYQWAVIGAGPAGIAAVGKLIDNGVSAKEIAWIDPAFKVGDFGTHWRNVPSNTSVELFRRFLRACNSFEYQACSEALELNHAEANKTCDLRLMAEALQWVSNHLKNKVKAITGLAEKLSLHRRTWNIQLKDSSLSAKQVVLAIGAEPKELTYSSPAVIPLQDAMDRERIKTYCDPNDTIAVFGSSHSAILVLKSLLENKVKKIINFYRSPLVYAVYFDDWILFDDTGLKGPTAEWARQNINDDLPKNLIRVLANEKNIERYLPECNKVIYTVGFKRRSLPIIEDFEKVDYLEQSGIIAPGLFGFGIAFPEAKMNPLGAVEYRVGLWKFMDYLQRIMPVWLNYSP